MYVHVHTLSPFLLSHFSHSLIVLDISKHVQLYKPAVHLLDSLASNGFTKPLLLLHVHEEREEKEEETGKEAREESTSGGSSSSAIVSLHSLLKKLKKIATTYSKTVRYVIN